MIGVRLGLSLPHRKRGQTAGMTNNVSVVLYEYWDTQCCFYTPLYDVVTTPRTLCAREYGKRDRARAVNIHSDYNKTVLIPQAPQAAHWRNETGAGTPTPPAAPLHPSPNPPLRFAFPYP